ncbi:MAG TPA: BamA/TamA family outer membrane protein [Terriglobia bacterium]|nr:BamA/TamA family outer membrane protein [Terriglobia bacterium]
MKTVIFVLWTASALMAFSQENPSPPANMIIERVDISGIDDSRLSAELRAAIQNLVGQVYNAQTIEALTQDIQVELPEYVAGSSTQPGLQPDRVRIVILVAKIADDDALRNNINSRYLVDAIRFEGTQLQISDELNAELQKMVGANVDSAQLSKLGERLRRENSSSGLYVDWKLQRSSEPQHVNVVYEARKAKDTLNFNVLRGTYHSRQGFGGQIFGMRYTHVPVGTLSFDMFNSADEFIERYAGYRAGYTLGDNRGLSFAINYSSFRAQWKTNTLEADRQALDSPGLYRLRDTLSGQLNWRHALDRRTLLGAYARMEFNELQMQSPTMGFQKSNVVRGSLDASHIVRTDRDSHDLKGSYEGSTGTAVIDSDFIFTRHEGKVDYSYSRQSHLIQFNFQAGRISGNAPMNERFSIGNSRTLRGWNKYEINPLGGDRMLYGSANYGYKVITGFYDFGSVWNASESSITRQSAGFRLGKTRCRNGLALLPHPECFSVTVGFPIHGGNAKPSFILGMGF